jgi:hypothetical protein
MLPGVIQAIMRIIASGVMPYPLAVRVHVRSVGMTFLIVEMSTVLGRGMFVSPMLLRVRFRRALFLRSALLRPRFRGGFRPSIGNMHALTSLRCALRRSVMLIMLCDSWERQQNANCQ